LGPTFGFFKEFGGMLINLKTFEQLEIHVLVEIIIGVWFVYTCMVVVGTNYGILEY